MKPHYILYGAIATMIIVLMFSNSAVEFFFGIPLSPINLQCPANVNKTVYRQQILCPQTTSGNSTSTIWVSFYTSPTCTDCWKMVSVKNKLQKNHPEVLFLTYDARICAPHMDVLPTIIVQTSEYNVSFRGIATAEDIGTAIESFQ